MSQVAGEIHADFAVSRGGVALGTFRVRLDHDKAPRTCANFIGLATGRRPWVDEATGAVRTGTPYYNGLTFHRLIHDFMIQGGSPNGLGSDGPGYVIQDEYHADLRHSGRYVVSMAKSGLPNTGGSQFFITFTATPFLDDKHSVFGEVIAGREIIDAFTDPDVYPTDRSAAGAPPTDPAYDDRPLTPIAIDSVTVGGADLEFFDISAPALMLPHIRPLRVTPFRNAAASSLALLFDRQARHNYRISLSPDLSSWIPFRQVLSADAVSPYGFTVTGLTPDRFFARVVDIDYSALPNPAFGPLAAGARLEINDRAGNTLELVANGTGGGTWSDSTGASGTIDAMATGDYAPAAGTFTSSGSNAHRLPLAWAQFLLDGPTGIDGRDFYDLELSFHTPSTGWTEGSVSGVVNPALPVLRSFTYTP